MPSPAALPNKAANLEALNSLITTTGAILKKSREVLDQYLRESSTEAEDRPEIDALALARDSATLIRAHTTKISLLIINEPFTPTAITGALRQLSSGPIPGLVSAVQICTPDRYTRTFRQGLARACSSVLSALGELVDAIPKNGKILPETRKNGANGDKGSLKITGITWERCDAVVRLANLGIVGYLSQRIGEHRDALKDVMEELKEWGEETGEDDDDESDGHYSDDLNGPENDVTAAQDMLDDLMNSQSHIPAGDPDKLRERLDSCMRRLRMTTLLCQAIIKRRIKTLPSLPTAVTCADLERIDAAISQLGSLVMDFGDVADAFYSLDREEVDRSMDDGFRQVSAISEMLKKPWGGVDQDEFTEWAKKFQVEVIKT